MFEATEKFLEDYNFLSKRIDEGMPDSEFIEWIANHKELMLKVKEECSLQETKDLIDSILFKNENRTE